MIVPDAPPPPAVRHGLGRRGAPDPARRSAWPSAPPSPSGACCAARSTPPCARTSCARHGPRGCGTDRGLPPRPAQLARGRAVDDRSAGRPDVRRRGGRSRPSSPGRASACTPTRASPWPTSLPSPGSRSCSASSTSSSTRGRRAAGAVDPAGRRRVSTGDEIAPDRDHRARKEYPVSETAARPDQPDTATSSSSPGRAYPPS